MTKAPDKGHKGQMSDREVMRLALEALEKADDWIETKLHGELNDRAIAALRQALKQPEQNDERFVNGGLPMGGMGFKVVNEVAQPKQDPWDTTDMAHRPGGLSMGQEHESRITSLEVRVAKLENPMTEHEKQLMAGQRNLIRTEPPKREWVGLTDEDIETALNDTQDGGGFDDFACAIEAILWRKNF